jgi:RNA polymerase sigma-70 factor, ECF subfamily
VLEEVFREEWGRVLASLVGFLGDFDKAEDATQEAFAIAAERWPASGVPPNPGAWLVTTARNRAIDRIRRERTLAGKIHLLPVPEAVMDEIDDAVIKDERLELIFTCCHPALPLDGQVALTLRALGGLETAEIARAFLVSEETMKRRLSRAKAKIKATGIPFAVPGAHLLPDRLDAVLAVIYLIYNEGYSGRVDLAAEAIHLGRVLATLMPDQPEAHGLLALMTIHHARRRARFSGQDLVLLEDQDRSLWEGDRSMNVLMVRAKIKEENVGDARAAIEKVIQALEQAQPAGVRYASCLLSDGVTFVALLELEDDGAPLRGFPAYQEMVENLEQWYAEPPAVEQMTVTGSYGLF